MTTRSLELLFSKPPEATGEEHAACSRGMLLLCLPAIADYSTTCARVPGTMYDEIRTDAPPVYLIIHTQRHSLADRKCKTWRIYGTVQRKQNTCWTVTTRSPQLFLKHPRSNWRRTLLAVDLYSSRLTDAPSRGRGDILALSILAACHGVSMVFLPLLVPGYDATIR